MLNDMASEKQVVVSTGNVLNLIDIKKKAGQQVTEELFESLQIVTNEWRRVNDVSDSNAPVHISPLNDDPKAKMMEEERADVKVGVKIFIHDADASNLNECLQNVYNTLGINMIESVILAYSPIFVKSTEQNTYVYENLDENPRLHSAEILPDLKVLWTELEKYVKRGQILQIGVSDLEEACFKTLHEESEIHPSIVQINLASCCVVPPGLQAFCKDNDIQLLTHSDPHEIITRDNLKKIFGSESNALKWCARYQVHIKCRGVLSLKGYILSVNVK